MRSFNPRIHKVGVDKASYFLWEETIGASGANQIAAYLWHFLQNLPSEVKEVR